MADDDNKNATLGDAVIGTGAGAAVAVTVPAIYGMSQLKNAKASDIISTAFSESAEHTKKMGDVLNTVLKESVLDTDKLKASIDKIYKDRGLDRAELTKQAKQLNKDFLASLSTDEAKKVHAEILTAVKGAVKIEGITEEQQAKLFEAITQFGKDGEVTKFADALTTHLKGAKGLNVNKAEILEAVEKGFNAHPGVKAAKAMDEFINKNSAKLSGVEPLGEIPKEEGGLLKALLERQAKQVESAKKLGQEAVDAVVGSVKIPGKTQEEVKKILTENPEALGTEWKAMLGAVEQAAKNNKKGFAKEAAGVFEAVENAGRKLLGSAKYKLAPGHAKPIVAFEAMPTKGKVTLGAAVIATTALGTWAASKRHGSHAEAVQASNGASAQVGG